MRTKFPTTFIYGLIDPRTDELRYVGKSDYPNQRLTDHLKDCWWDATHKNFWLRGLKRQNIQPILVIIEEIPEHVWEEMETWWIAYFKSLGANLTNATPGGSGIAMTREIRNKISKAVSIARTGKFTGSNNSFYGKKHTAETIRKMSESKSGPNHPMYGKPRTEEHCRNISIALTGYKKTEEHKKNISIGNIGKIITEKTKQLLSIANTGRKHTPEELLKMSIGNTGKKHSEATKKLLSDIKKGIPQTEKTKQSISESLKGRVFTEEHRKKLSEAAKRRCIETGNAIIRKTV